MSIYLEDHPPARRQYIDPRRDSASGAIVVHTAENVPKLSVPDTSAESIAAFISSRSDPGSYHSVIDTDSIVRMGRFEWEMFGEGTGGNRFALHLASACRTSDWVNQDPVWVGKMITQKATAAVEMICWVNTQGIGVPISRITAAQYRAKMPGFIAHADLDPGRRSDPGARFPWDVFLNMVSHILNGGETVAVSINDFAQTMANVDEIYRAYTGYEPDSMSRQTWGVDLIARLIRGEDPAKTLEFISWKLAGG